MTKISERKLMHYWRYSHLILFNVKVHSWKTVEKICNFTAKRSSLDPGCVPVQKVLFGNDMHSIGGTGTKVLRFAIIYTIASLLEPCYLLKLWRNSLKWGTTVLFRCKHEITQAFIIFRWEPSSKEICDSCFKFSAIKSHTYCLLKSQMYCVQSPSSSA